MKTQFELHKDGAVTTSMKNWNKGEYDNCICVEWDRKGWSVCGIPCPIHNKFTKAGLAKKYEKANKVMTQFLEDIKNGKVKKEEIPF